MQNNLNKFANPLFPSAQGVKNPAGPGKQNWDSALGGDLEKSSAGGGKFRNLMSQILRSRFNKMTAGPGASDVKVADLSPGKSLGKEQAVASDEDLALLFSQLYKIDSDFRESVSLQKGASPVASMLQKLGIGAPGGATSLDALASGKLSLSTPERNALIELVSAFDQGVKGKTTSRMLQNSSQQALHFGEDTRFSNRLLVADNGAAEQIVPTGHNAPVSELNNLGFSQGLAGTPLTFTDDSDFWEQKFSQAAAMSQAKTDKVSTLDGMMPLGNRLKTMVPVSQVTKAVDTQEDHQEELPFSFARSSGPQLGSAKSKGSVPKPLYSGVAEQVVERFDTFLQDGSNKLVIQLNPEHLGKVTVRVQINGDHLTAQITVETHAAQQALEANIAHLKDSLSNQGLNVRNVQFVIADQGLDAQAGNNREQTNEQGQSNRRSHNAKVANGTDFAGEMTDVEPMPSSIVTDTAVDTRV